MLVVTAPTSTIGRQVLDKLLDHGEAVRVIARDPSRISQRARERVQIVQGSHKHRDVVDRAFAGADAVFWLVPADTGAPSVEAAYLDFSRAACEAFVTRGVQRVVGISALGRGVDLPAGHVTASLMMDDLIASTGVNYRALANASFMENILRQLEPIKTQGMFFWPIDGDRKVPACATRDIAAVATRLLLDRSWTGQGSVPVMGPEDLSYNEMAQIMSAVLGKPVRFQEIPAESLRPRLISNGYSEPMAQAMIDMLAAKNRGLDNAEPRTPEATTPTSFRQWCEEALQPGSLSRRSGPETGVGHEQ